MRTPKFVAATLTIMSLQGCAACLSSHPDAADVMQQGRSRLVGWEGVVETVSHDPELYEYMIGQMCRGSEEWLQVGHEMQTTRSAEISEAISSAASAALAHSPQSVLSIFGSGACLAPEYLPSNCNVEHWKERTLAALATVGPQLKSVAQECEQSVRGY